MFRASLVRRMRLKSFVPSLKQDQSHFGGAGYVRSIVTACYVPLFQLSPLQDNAVLPELSGLYKDKRQAVKNDIISQFTKPVQKAWQSFEFVL